MKKIICIGSATRDIFVALPETKIIDNHKDVTAKKLMAFEFGAKEYADSFREEVGGSAVNVAAGLIKSGYRSFVFSRTSKGEVGKWILKKISKLKIKKNYMQQRSKEESEISVIISDRKNMDHIILRTGDSVVQFDLKKAIEKFREKIDWVFVASQKSNWQENWELIKIFAQKKKSKIAINPSGYQIGNNPKELLWAIKDATVIFLNRDEALELMQKSRGSVNDDISWLMKELISGDGQAVVITDGENGAYAGDKKGIHHLKTLVDKKTDTVGAGDAFSSGFLASFVEDGDIRKALSWGMANSSSVISSTGATNGLLSGKELKYAGEKLIEKIETL